MPKSEIDEFLKGTETDTKSEQKADPFELDESDPLASKEEGTKKDVATDDSKKEDDEKVPFHKNPKLQRFIEKEVEKRIGSVKPSAKETPAKESTVDEGEELLTRIIGNDTAEKRQAVKDFKTYLASLEERGAQKALDKIKAEEDARQAEEADARKQLVSGFDAIEEEFDIDLTSNTTSAKKERSEFIDFIRRVSPKDAEGDIIQYPDIVESYRIYKSQQKPGTDNKRAKDIASRSITRSTDATVAPTTGKTWKDVDKIFSRISG